MSFKQQFDYVGSLTDMYEKVKRVHGEDSDQARSMGVILYEELTLLRSRLSNTIWGCME